MPAVEPMDPLLVGLAADYPVLTGWAMVAGALVIASLAAVSLLRRDRARGGRTWRRLCRRLGVTVAERRLLERAAAAISAPCGALLVSRGCFDAAVERLPAGGDTRRRMADVRRRVFAA